MVSYADQEHNQDLVVELVDRSGRESLTGGGVHSPRVQFRVPEAVAAKAEHRARAEGITLSELAREALVRYLAS